MADLSVLIPARNEEWLAQTVRDVVAHSSEATEVIVVLDGAPADPPLEAHPRVQVVVLPDPIGQRAATNLAARLSTARYVMKLDAHCAVAPGFDTALMDAARDLGDAVVQVPAQYNLHVFDWVCACGVRVYQGPKPTTCACHDPRYTRDVVWRPRLTRRTTAWRFDASLHFQYWRAFEKTPRGRGAITDTLSCLGACWFLSRDRYWALGGLDEGHGSWGQMGTEIGCKAWLSGGRLVTNQQTWFAHLFRTQPGFGFPYAITGADQDQARAYSRRLWLEQGWPGAERPLAWLIDHFAPVPDWTVPPPALTVIPPRSAAATVGIVTYTDSRLDPAIDRACRRQLRRAADGLPILRVALRPPDSVPALGQKPPRDPDAPRRVRTSRTESAHVWMDGTRGPLMLFRQILKGLELLETDLVFFAEHDVLYPAEHFTLRPTASDRYAYNVHVYKVGMDDGRAVHYRCEQTSGLVADRGLLLDHYRRRVAQVSAHGFSRRLGFEPGKPIRHGGLDDTPRERLWSAAPLVDLRHKGNLTPSRWSPGEFRNKRYAEGWTEAASVPGWGTPAGRALTWVQEITEHGPLAD